MPTVLAPETTDLASRLRMAVSRLGRVLRTDSESGITWSMFSALATIDRAGSLTLGDLAARERVQPPTMTRIAQALVEAGLVRRDADATDRRVAHLRLTPAGARLLSRARRRKDALLATRLSELSPRELGVLEQATAIIDRLSGGEAR